MQKPKFIKSMAVYVEPKVYQQITLITDRLGIANSDWIRSAILAKLDEEVVDNAEDRIMIHRR